MNRRTQIEVTRNEIVLLDNYSYNLKLLEINKVKILSQFYSSCRQLQFNSNWIYSVSVSSNYIPILKRTEHEDDLRYYIAGVCCGSGPSIIIFDIETGRFLYEINAHDSSIYIVLISNPLTESRTFPVIVSGSEDGLMKVWDLQTGLEIHTIGKGFHTGPVKALYVYEGLNPILYSATDSIIWMWLLESGELIRQIITKNIVNSLYVYRSLEAFQDENNPAILIAGTSSGLIQAWSLDCFEIYHEFVGHQGQVLCLTAVKTKNLHILISGGFDWNVKLWNIITGNILYSIIDPNHPSPASSISILYTPKIGLVIGYYDGTITVVDITNAMKLFELHGHKDTIKSLCCTMHPRPFIISCSIDSTIMIWDLPTAAKEEIKTLLTNHIKVGLENVLLWKSSSTTTTNVTRKTQRKSSDQKENSFDGKENDENKEEEEEEEEEDDEDDDESYYG